MTDPASKPDPASNQSPPLWRVMHEAEALARAEVEQSNTFLMSQGPSLAKAAALRAVADAVRKEFGERHDYPLSFGFVERWLLGEVARAEAGE